MQAEFLTLGHLHLDDNRLNQHLGTTDIEARNHRLQRRHFVRIGSDDQAVSAGICFDSGFIITRALVRSALFEPSDILHDPR